MIMVVPADMLGLQLGCCMSYQLWVLGCVKVWNRTMLPPLHRLRVGKHKWCG